MKVILSCLFSLCIGICFAEPNVTNTFLMVDQHNKLNVSGIASVEDVATNAVKVQIATAQAEAAQQTATSVTNQLNGIVSNIMSNNVVIYRKGYTDAFAGLVIYSPSDVLLIADFQKVSLEAGVLQAHIEYVCTANLGTTKPIVLAHDTLAGGTNEFVQVSSANVTTPIVHNESRTIGGVTYEKWYEIDVSIDVAGTASSYFYFIRIEGDTPSGDGTSLNLPNGVTGGYTGQVTWGDKLLVFVGGMLLEVRDAN